MMDRQLLMYLLMIHEKEYLKHYSNIENIILNTLEFMEQIAEGEHPTVKIEIGKMLYSFRISLAKLNKQYRIATTLAKNQQFNFLSKINTNSEILIDDKNKFIFDKKLSTNPIYTDYKFINLNKTQTLEFSKLLVEQYIDILFKDNKELMDFNNEPLTLSNIKYLIDITDSTVRFLDSLMFNL